MSAAFIIDASMALAWCFADETTAATAFVQDRLKHEAAVVPTHWHLEVANSLAMAERRHRIDATGVDEFIVLLAQMQIEVDDESADRAFTEVLTIARSHRLTCYDAAYLDLSLRRGLPLATLDEQLRSAAAQLGVDLLGK